MRTLTCLAAASLALFGTAAAHAHVVEGTIPLTVQESFPPATGTLPGAGGLGTLELTEDFTIQYEVAVHDLTGPATMAHIHAGAPGVFGDITPFGTLTKIDGTTFRGETPALTREQVETLLDGGYYFNVHTTTNGLGEVRGQIVGLERVAGKCSCLDLARKKFLGCVKREIKKLDSTERKSDAVKALRRAVKKSICGLTKTKKPLACCLPLNGAGEIIGGTMCAAVKKDAQCTALGGTVLTGESCLPDNPCFLPASPSGAFIDGMD